jgi:hypothetical protein
VWVFYLHIYVKHKITGKWKFPIYFLSKIHSNCFQGAGETKICVHTCFHLKNIHKKNMQKIFFVQNLVLSSVKINS